MDKFGEVGNKAQTVVWRIENFEPVRVDEAQHGTLYSGDSYLVLHSTESSSGKLSHDIYFWLGAETSQDESTSAATHAVLLDDVLGGSAVHHREVCGEESAGFLKVFKSLKVLKGGKGTALRHAGAGQYDPRLVHVKLTRGLLVAEVPLAAASLNSGDSFILDTATTVFLWHGPEASPREKSKALDVAVGIRDEDHAGSAELVVVEGDDVVSADALTFYKALGVADPASVTLQPPVADADAAAALEPPRLFTAASGAFIELEEKPLRRGLLVSDGTFFLVAAGSVWVWTGKATSPDARAAASELGSEFVQLQGLPSNTTVKVTKENLEPALFKLHFRDWPQDELLQYVRHAKAPQEAPPQDVAALAASMLTAPPSEEEKAMFAEGGTTQVWLVAAGSGDLQELPSQQASQLHDAECYIVQYTYPVAGGSTAAVIYYWLGRNSSTQEQATAAMVANRLHQTDFQGRSTLVRVAQGAEPSHFHRAFPAPLIIHDGDAAGAANGGARLYHVKGDTAREAVAVEVAPVAASLNSGDCYVLVGAGGASCCWVGKHSTEAEIEAAIEVATALGAEDAIVEEGDEEDVFWEALGGKAEYATFGTVGAPKLVPRLFQVNAAGAGGRVAVTPIPAFSQDDLSDGDVMLLDTYNEVFVWVGTTASAAEQTAAADLAQQYVTAAAASDGRSPATAITRVQAGAEPPLFTCHFAGWDAAKRPAFVDPYETKLAALKQQQTAAAAAKDAEPAAARGLPEEEEEEAAGGHANGSGDVEEAADDDIEDDIEDAEPASPMTDIEDAEPASPMTEDDDENQLSNPFAAGSPAKAAAAAAKQAEQQQQQQEEEEELEEDTQETQEETQEEEQEADAPPTLSGPVAEPLEGASLLEAAAAKLDSLGSPAPAAASPAPAAAAPAADDDDDDVPASPAAVASPAPVATTTADGAAAAEEATAADTPASPAAPSPKVSVAEMARLAAVRDASVEPPPVPKPVSTEPRSWANGTKALVSEGSGSAPTTPVKPVVLTAHDTKNTANVAQILSAGSFEKVPLQDFLPYSELVGMRLEDGIDVSRKEDYLSEEEFATVFGFTRDEFQKMPAWRKIQTKKKHMLF